MTTDPRRTKASVNGGSRARVYAILAIFAFAAEAAFAAIHLFEGVRYRDFDYWPHDPLADTLLLFAWVGGALGFLLRRWWCLYLGSIGAFASIAHGLLFSLSRAFVGLPFLLAGALQLTCLIKARRSFLPRTPRAGASTG